ncbi:MAG TPA: phosphate ABC transporter substrate-binding protein PstS, partial [Nitrospirota bacterium]|nr:phosphate ABC transporter substrate-binding protein PstS [Nitrospirota bacterium]
PLKAPELREAGLFQFPMVSGAVAIIYNLPGVPAGLKLSSQTVADIYLGKVKTWNAPAIAKQNPGVSLPSLPVIVVHRSDGSGTTNIFTWYLEDVSSQWKLEVGSGKSVSWPAGIGAKGNEGVAGIVKQTRGAVGYAELAYALQNKLTYAHVGNREGNYIAPSAEASIAAAANAKVGSDYYSRYTYAPGKDSYPICGFTYLLAPKKADDPAKAKKFRDFVKWAFDKGDKDANDLHYVPVPEPLKKKILADLENQVK